MKTRKFEVGDIVQCRHFTSDPWIITRIGQSYLSNHRVISGHFLSDGRQKSISEYPEAIKRYTNELHKDEKRIAEMFRMLL